MQAPTSALQVKVNFGCQKIKNKQLPEGQWDLVWSPATYNANCHKNCLYYYLETTHNHITTKNKIQQSTEERYRHLPLSCTGEVAFVFSALDLECHCSSGRITRALGFSLGTKRASAFGVLGVSSSSLKNGTWLEKMIKKKKENTNSNGYHPDSSLTRYSNENI